MYFRVIEYFTDSKKSSRNYYSMAYSMDLWKYFSKKIQKTDLQQPPKFCEFDLPNFGATASWNSGKQFFVKFCFYRQI